MSTVRELHQQAMELAQEALIRRERRDLDAARELAARALPLEIRAAGLVEKVKESEPTRSILYRGAASLAFQAGDYATAQRLVAEGLSGFPPPRVEQELKDIFEEINFESHLQVRNAPLGVAQMQLAIVGQDVGFGRMTYAAFNDRIQAVITMITRTIRRLTGEPYRRHGPGTALSRLFTPIIATPEPGSFAVRIELVQRAGAQQTFLTTGEEVIDQVVEGVRKVQAQQLEQLQLTIGNQEYFVNFMAAAQQLAPDGESVTMVGLTTAKTQVSFTQPKPDIVVPVMDEAVSTPPLLDTTSPNTLTGVLDEATVRENDQVGLTTRDNKRFTLWVREGMDDLVRTYFNRTVEVKVQYRNEQAEILSVSGIEE